MPAESRVVSDTVVAVTGASPGIGAATARLLLEAGAKVAMQARRRERLDALADEFGADRPPSARVASNGQHRGTAAARQAS
jgi:NADP-dependent 3-hydroxy acid dehydrogenase YdfG